MLRSNTNKAPAPRVVKQTSLQQPPATSIKPPTQQPQQNNLGLTQTQYKSFLETKKMIGSRVDDDVILRKIKQDLSVRQIVNALSQLSISEKSNPIIFSKLSAVTNSKQKQVIQYSNPCFLSLRATGTIKQNYFNLNQLYKFSQYQSNFKPEQYV